MKKLLLAQHAQCLKVSAIDFGCYLARLTRSRLTGVFLEDVQSERPAQANQGTVRTGAAVVSVQAADATGITGENIRLFREACVCRGVTPRIHRDRGIPAPEIIDESRFADLIVMDPEISFTTKNESLPGHFVHDILHVCHQTVHLSFP